MQKVARGSTFKYAWCQTQTAVQAGCCRVLPFRPRRVHCAVVLPTQMKLRRPSREAAVKSACRSWRGGAFPDACGATLPYLTVDPIADAHGIQGRATKAAILWHTSTGMGGSWQSWRRNSRSTRGRHRWRPLGHQGGPPPVNRELLAPAAQRGSDPVHDVHVVLPCPAPVALRPAQGAHGAARTAKGQSQTGALLAPRVLEVALQNPRRRRGAAGRADVGPEAADGGAHVEAKAEVQREEAAHVLVATFQPDGATSFGARLEASAYGYGGEVRKL